MYRRTVTVVAIGFFASAFFSGCERTLPPDQEASMARAKEIRKSFLSGVVVEESSSDPSAQPTGFATLRGTFKLDTGSLAQLPPRRRLEITGGDAAVCAPGGAAIFSEDLVVDSSSGGIQNIVVFLSSKIPDDDLWMHSSAKPGKTDSVIFDQDKCRFLNRMVALQVTQKLEIHNSDIVAHNTKLAGGNFNQIIPIGGAVPVVHRKEARQPYIASCSIHPWMSAWILPRENSYFAVTEEDGSFEIPNLPAGVELELKAWQENSKFLQKVTVNGTSTKWSRGRFKVTLTPDEETNLDVVVDVTSFK